MRYLFLFFPILITSCISNKKHQAAIDLINTEHVVSLAAVQTDLDTARAIIIRKDLNIAEGIGENNILLMLRDELQNEIVELESNIENLSSTSSSAQKNLSATLVEKERQIEQLKATLAEVEKTIVDYEATINQITGDLNYISQDYPNEIEVNLGFDYATIEIKESFLFKKNSASRMTDEGGLILEKFSNIFAKFPNINVQVIGHTDTTPPKDKRRYSDNWNFSALQSATIVRALVDEYDVSANQLTLSAKAEFAPRGSNASEEGKSRNRRIEFFIKLQSQELAKSIRAVLEKVD